MEGFDGLLQHLKDDEDDPKDQQDAFIDLLVRVFEKEGNEEGSGEDQEEAKEMEPGKKPEKKKIFKLF